MSKKAVLTAIVHQVAQIATMAEAAEMNIAQHGLTVTAVAPIAAPVVEVGVEVGVAVAVTVQERMVARVIPVDSHPLSTTSGSTSSRNPQTQATLVT
jgi:antitoxin (DNA-binding transcriptional repressor) of toxin-antitoxin stability system